MAVKKSELYSMLWEACNKLRGGVEPARYKDYVLVKRSLVSVGEGIRQMLTNQKKENIQSFFSTMQLLMAGNEAEGLKYGVIETEEKYYLQWREDERAADDLSVSIRAMQARESNRLRNGIISLCQHDRLMMLIHDFVIFDAGIKKTARHNQFFAILAAQKRIQDGQGGIIWNTQGSGKFHFSVCLAVAMVAATFLDFILAGLVSRIIAGTAGIPVENSEQFVSCLLAAKAAGFGQSWPLLFAAPVVLLYSYNKVPKQPLISILIPLAAIVIIILLVFEAVYQGISYFVTEDRKIDIDMIRTILPQITQMLSL